MGVVLFQQSPNDEKWHLVAFLSKSLSVVKWNYDVHNKEMLAIIRALEEWQHFLEGTTHPVEIWTDHRNLQYFMMAKKLNRRQARWSLYLARFDFMLLHRPGCSMEKPNALSRRSDHGSRATDNENLVLLKPEFFAVHAMEGVDIEGEEKEILSEIQQGVKKGNQHGLVVKAVRKLGQTPNQSVHSLEWAEREELLFFCSKIYVPNLPNLCQ